MSEWELSNAAISRDRAASRVSAVGFMLIVVGVVVWALASPWGVLPLLAGLLLLLWNYWNWNRSANGSGEAFTWEFSKRFSGTDDGPRTIIERLSAMVSDRP
jgi:hypothetical protein